MEHMSRRRLEAGLNQIRDSPRDGGQVGQVVLVVRRPAVGVRGIAAEAMLDLPAGSMLTVGQAVLEVSEVLRLRGMNTRVVQSGIVRPGDLAAKIPRTASPAEWCCGPGAGWPSWR